MKKEWRSPSSELRAGRLKVDGFGHSGGGKQGGGISLHTPDDLVQGQGVGGKPYIRIPIAFSATSQASDIVSLFLEHPRAYITFCGYLLRVSKLKKEGARSDAAAAGEYRLKGSGPSGGGKQGGSRMSPHA